MINRSYWLSLPLETRKKLAMTLNIPKTAGNEVVDNRVVCDGFSDENLNTVTLELLQAFLNSVETDFYALLEQTIAKVESEDINTDLLDNMPVGPIDPVVSTPVETPVEVVPTPEPAIIEPAIETPVEAPVEIAPETPVETKDQPNEEQIDIPVIETPAVDPTTSVDTPIDTPIDAPASETPVAGAKKGRPKKS